MHHALYEDIYVWRGEGIMTSKHFQTNWLQKKKATFLYNLRITPIVNFKPETTTYRPPPPTTHHHLATTHLLMINISWRNKGVCVWVWLHFLSINISHLHIFSMQTKCCSLFGETLTPHPSLFLSCYVSSLKPLFNFCSSFC